ncbi:DUF885 domain-containing protein [Streptomyces sp. AJS327]|uniref:DUF885 domain-containing protein n=1 Tax=Streptomyces sp. AJS327 TaxID=2545265 RepID=UPI0015DFF692|nr:DUF885 domain-containing protein [Streptomyces sp. AJS327]MBA0051704.1 DUF885 domain-containing protein [Streptomyces sp. AJS327]
MPDNSTPQLPRQIADDYVDALTRLDPTVGTYLGERESHAKLPDYSPEGQDEIADLARGTLKKLADAERQPEAEEGVERRCARLLRERLNAQLALHDSDEHLRQVSNLRSPLHFMREAFSLNPVDTAEDWLAVGERLRAVPDAVAGYRSSLTLGLERGLPGGPRATRTVLGQLENWIDPVDGWFPTLVADAPAGTREGLEPAVREATAALAELRAWMESVYAPAVADAPDPVGRERYARSSRFFNGADLDLQEAYEFGWSEYHRLMGQMREEAGRILPGAGPWEALAHLAEHGTRIEGVDEVQRYLQGLMDEAMTSLDGTHFDLAEPIRRVESRIAPAGGSVAPFYYPPSEDFSRPGRTYLPTMGKTSFPIYDLVSIWYHEGVPGHHLQLGQWVYVADQLSRYQATIGMVEANAEGWALYAERLMDELGYLGDAERRLGYLDAQMMRSIRVIVDIGVHLGLTIPADSPYLPGERWTTERAEEFFGMHSGRSPEFIASELTRYLSMPGQAIGYKIGERVWLRGREAAQRAHGSAFDAKRWHMAALSQGSLGLDDLADELAQL